MNFFSPKRKPWQVAWCYDAAAVLWRVMISPDKKIIGEVRNPEEKSVSFFCLDEQTGRPLWEGKRFDETWWIGIAEIVEGTVYFHGYRKPDMPQHQGIIAVDSGSGQTKWMNADLTFLFEYEEKVYVSTEGFEALRYKALDTQTGDPVQDLGTDATLLEHMRENLNRKDFFSGYGYPVPLEECIEDRQEFDSLLAEKIPYQKLVGQVEAMRFDEFLIATWHEHRGASNGNEWLFDQRILALTSEGTILFQDTINEKLRAVGIDSFFTKDKQLLFVKDAHILTAYSLQNVLHHDHH